MLCCGAVSKLLRRFSATKHMRSCKPLLVQSRASLCHSIASHQTPVKPSFKGSATFVSKEKHIEGISTTPSG